MLTTCIILCAYNRDSYSQELAGNESEDSESKPTKLVSVVTQVRLPNVEPGNDGIEFLEY